MNEIIKSIPKGIVLFLAAILVTSNVFAQQTTAFTYQGQLRDGGTNANGAYAMTFKLYDAASDGNQIGSTLTNNVNLANGLFTVSLDFGASAFDGNTRWLEITVEGETLLPRVQVLPAPYALFAAVAGTVTNHAIMNAQLATNSVATTNIQHNAITSVLIADGAVTNRNLAPGAVTGDKLATNAVATTNIRSNAITSPLIADGAVTNRNLASNSVTSDKLAFDSASLARVSGGAAFVGADGVMVFDNGLRLHLADPNGTADWDILSGYLRSGGDFFHRLHFVNGNGLTEMVITEQPTDSLLPPLSGRVLANNISASSNISASNNISAGGIFFGDGRGLSNVVAVPQMQRFPDGSSTFVVPDGVTRIMVEMWGGGGGGGGDFTGNGTCNSETTGGGGGGGTYAKGVFSVTAGTPYLVLVGAGGLGGLAGSTPQPGQAGQSSSFGGLLTAAGGSGGGAAPNPCAGSAQCGNGGNGGGSGGGGSQTVLRVGGGDGGNACHGSADGGASGLGGSGGREHGRDGGARGADGRLGGGGGGGGPTGGGNGGNGGVAVYY